ncbi:MAG: DNA translocase FtsK [Ardenticatenaceae bacterium]|nr:DNA translocase FtsK [Ardenticatenaceae bacterium]
MITGFLLIAVGVLALLGLLSTNQGFLTGALLNGLWSLFGWGMPVALTALLLSGFWLVLWGIKNPPPLSILRLTGGVFLFLVFQTFATILAVLWENGYSTFDNVLAAQIGGGWVGYISSNFLIDAVGLFGTVFILIVLGIAAVFMATGIRWADLRDYFTWEREDQAPVQPALIPFPRRSERAVTAGVEAVDEEEEEDEETAPRRSAPITEAPARGRRKSKATLKKKSPEDKEKGARGGRGSRQETQPAEAPQPIFLGSDTDRVRSWRLPQLSDMLNLGSDSSTNDQHIHQQALVIEETLTSFGAPGVVVDVNHGPTIIQYCVEPQFLVQRSGKRTKVKVGKIASLADDLALALAARSVRIQAPVPGRPYVGIEVPNEAKALVSLRDVMESSGFGKLGKKTSLAIGLGEDVAGIPISIDLSKMPHMLVAGATGSGKSVCINAIIACLLLQNSPEDLKLVMVDPKRVELTGYNGIPHLAAPVVVDMDRVVGTLQWAMREMDSRYKLLSENGARNIEDYNAKAVKKKRKKLPYILIIIDELADLMMMSPEDTERSIARLAQMARATGIHMILATQRPSVDVVTGLIKANFPARVAFAVASSTDSRVVLDTVGAERLLGQGDMLFQSPTAPAPVRMQGCFVSDAELNKIIEYWKQERRRATSEIAQERQSNLFTAETDAVAKEELNSDVWDRDSSAEKEEKQAALEQIKKDHSAPEPVTMLAEEAPEDANPLIPDDLDDEEEAKQQRRQKAAKATAPTPKEKPSKVQEAEPQPPLWEEMREQLIEEQEKALLAQQFGEDDLWDDAVALVRELGKASTSLLQRRFRIGYTRAARLIDRMEEENIIGPMPGNNKAREILPPADDE